jgi:hypothetical protein
MSDWQLFHAAAKTELARSFTVAEAARRAFCFSIFFDDLFTWNGPYLCLHNGAVESRKDSARTNASGRFGEGCTLRFMQHIGYDFWDHLPTLWRRAQGPIDHSEQVTLPQLLITDPALMPSEQPDFIVESVQGQVALAESKGSFVSPASAVSATLASQAPSTRIKSVLQEARSQLTNWQGLITPQPSTFAVSTFLREVADTRDPSLIAYTDPPGKDERLPGAIEFSSDFVRRGNYGAWMIGMGFEATGNAIRNRTTAKLQKIPMRVLSFGGHDFAVSLNPFLCPCLVSNFFGGTVGAAGFFHRLVFDFHPYIEYISRRFDQTDSRVPIIGLEVKTLRLASAAAESPTSLSLLGVERILSTENVPLYLSIFPDGSLFGQIASRRLFDSRPEIFYL